MCTACVPGSCKRMIYFIYLPPHVYLCCRDMIRFIHSGMVLNRGIRVTGGRVSIVLLNWKTLSHWRQLRPWTLKPWRNIIIFLRVKLIPSLMKRQFIHVNVHGCLTCIHVCTPYLCSALRDQKRGPDPLELECPMVVSSHVGAGNWTQVFCKSSQYS